MSIATTFVRAQTGVLAPLVHVETDLSKGLPKFNIVGLPETAVKESKERVRSAILNSQFEFPARHITVNLAPADLPKRGGRFDLAIAIGILAASEQLPSNALHHYEFAGELALNGDLRPNKSLLPFAIATQQAGRQLILCHENLVDVQLLTDLPILPARSLLEVAAHLTRQRLLTPARFDELAIHPFDLINIAEVRGQQHAKRALEIAAAGQHHLLFVGPPGTGKTMLSHCMQGILPPLNNDEALEVAALHSLHKSKSMTHNARYRPCRTPHHTASYAAIVGGSNPPVPGEISLAHQGVLFMDEIPEFRRDVLEALREPLESGTISIARPGYHETFPARFQLIAAMNPCPCGYLNTVKCQCTPAQIRKYQMKISGPLLDRIDMHIEVPPLPEGILSTQYKNGEVSETVQQRVILARQRQFERQQHTNRYLKSANLEERILLTAPANTLMSTSAKKFNLSSRSIQRCLKVSRTIADLEGEKELKDIHIAEALTFCRRSSLLM
jgi:magnesium chelatase family protein